MPWDENPEFLERYGWQLVRSSVAVTALLVALLAIWSVDRAIVALVCFPGVFILNGTVQYVVRVSVPSISDFLKRCLKTVLLAILLISLTACTSSHDGRAWTNIDSWFVEAPEIVDGVNPDWKMLEDGLVYSVDVQTRSVALALLVEESWLRLSAEQFAEMTGMELLTSSEKAPYLLRAVRLDEGTGGYIVAEFEGHLKVHYGTMGHEPRPMRRDGVIVLLPRAPAGVYPICSMVA